MPLLGVIFYFSISPRYLPVEIIKAKLISLFILTIIIPLLLYWLLNLIGIAKTINLETTRERIMPLILNSVLILIVLDRILTPSQSIELYFFFLGILISNMACLFLALLKFKASIHMIGITGLFMFLVALSIHFNINISGPIAIVCILIGALASSRLHLKAHSSIELIIGLFVGLIPQLILVTYWL